MTQTKQWGDTGNRFNYKSLRQCSQGKRLYYIFPFKVNKSFLAKLLHTTNENRGLLWKLGFGGETKTTTQNSCFLRYCRLPLPMLLRRQHKYLISTIILSSFTFQYMRKQQYTYLCHLFILHYHTVLGGLSAVENEMIWHHSSVLSSTSMRTTSLGFLCKIPNQKWARVEKYSTVSLQKGTEGLFT